MYITFQTMVPVFVVSLLLKTIGLEQGVGGVLEGWYRVGNWGCPCIRAGTIGLISPVPEFTDPPGQKPADMVFYRRIVTVLGLVIGRGFLLEEEKERKKKRERERHDNKALVL